MKEKSHGKGEKSAEPVAAEPKSGLLLGEA